MLKIQDALITVNSYSRPGKKLVGVSAIVIHWVANTGSTAQQNRNFFESRKGGKLGYGSGHYIIGNDGEVLLCIPEDEVSYNCGSKIYTNYATYKFGEKATSSRSSPNYYTIAVELCHINSEGEFSDECLEACMSLVAQLCKQYKLNAYQDIITHQMVVGWKQCPRWFVEHPDEFEYFRSQVDSTMNQT